MQFSQTTSPYNGLVQDVEVWLGYEYGDISGNSALLGKVTSKLNKAYHRVVGMILDAQDAWDFDDSNHSDFATATTALVANQRDYSLPTKTLKVKRVEISYDGVNYYKATPKDIGTVDIGTGDDTTIDGQYSKTSPVVDLKARSILIYPRASAADVTAGGEILIEYSREVDEFTTADTTQEPGIDEHFHGMISAMAALEMATPRQLPVKEDLKQVIADFKVDLKKWYSKKQTDEDLVLAGPDKNYN